MIIIFELNFSPFNVRTQFRRGAKESRRMVEELSGSFDRKRIMKIITLINCLVVVVVVAFLVCLKAGGGNYGRKNLIETNEKRTMWRERETLSEVCVCSKIIQLFFRYLWEINYPSSKIITKYSPVKHFSNGGGGFCVKYLWIHEFSLPSRFSLQLPPAGVARTFRFEDNRITIRCDFYLL